MICKICEDRFVVFTTDPQGDVVAKPCPCVTRVKSEAVLRALQDDNKLKLEAHYLTDFQYVGEDKKEKDSILGNLPLQNDLWLWGGSKTQKTSFGILILKRLVGLGIPVDYTTMGDLNRLIFGESVFTQKSDGLLSYYRNVKTLIIDDVYSEKFITFSAGTQNQYWSDFVSSRKYPTVFISNYHPSSPPKSWGSVILGIDRMDIVAFNYHNIDDLPSFYARRRKVSK